MKNRIVYLSLACIVLLGGFLRFYRLGEIPTGFHRDEAFLGYNAYSILKTGKDMNGKVLPLHLKSFLYSPAGYSYASIPFIALFGLNAFSVRFASALFGTLTILLTYFLVKELFSKSSLSTLYSLLSTLFLALSPWHLNLSRTATENTLVVFFITLGTLLYLLWHKNKHSILLLTSFLLFTITLFIYQAPRAFLPLFIPALILSSSGLTRGSSLNKTLDSRLRGNDRLLFPFIFFFLTILLPLILIFRSPMLSLRLNTVSIFSNAETQLTLDESLREDGVANQPTIIARMFHNKLVAYTQQLLQNYFSHFSYPFLFTDKGLPDRYRIPNQGLLYIVELPLLLAGLYNLFKDRKPYSRLLLAWLFLTPVGSAIAFDDVPNLQRTLLVFPALSIITTLGLFKLIQLTRTKVRYYIIAAFVVFYLYGSLSYFHSYYIHQPVHRPWSRHEGYKELVANVNTLLPQYQRAVVTDRQSAPTIFFLFFGKYDPAKFQQDTRDSTFPDYDRIAFGNYEFSQEECPLRINTNGTGHTGKPGVLYVNFGTCKPVEGAKELVVIRRGDTSIVFRILALHE